MRDNLVMRRALVPASQKSLALFGHYGRLVIRTGKCFDSIERFPEHYGDELNLVTHVAPDKIRAAIAWYFADARKHFGLEE
jgi:hypothetical protein